MEKSIGVVMDPIVSINFEKDTTLRLLLAAQKQGFKLFYMEQQNLFLENGQPFADARPLQVFDNSEQWFQLESFITLPCRVLMPS